MKNLDTRLRKLESQCKADYSMVLVVKKFGESDEEAEARFEAWKRGEPVVLLSEKMDQVYEGGDVRPLIITVMPPYDSKKGGFYETDA